MTQYVIEKTTPTVYLDAGGRPVRGFLVTVEFPDYREIHEIQVPTLNPDVVRDAIETLLADRDELATLGGA